MSTFCVKFIYIDLYVIMNEIFKKTATPDQEA